MNTAKFHHQYQHNTTATMSNKDYKEDPMSDDDDENSDIHGSLFMVQQYLYENGYKDALKALERESYVSNQISYRSYSQRFQVQT